MTSNLNLQNLESKLGFTTIRELLAAKCLSEKGRGYLQRMRFTTRFDIVERMLRQTDAFRKLLVEDQPFPADNYLDAAPILYKVRIEGVWLDEEELHQLRQVLQTFLQVVRYFRERPGRYPELESLLEGLTINDLVVRRIDRVVDQEGLMKPNASPELAKISAKISEKESEIRRLSQRLFDRYQDLGYLTEQLGITIREGRLVLPVLAEHKRHVAGFVHDESQTGQTVFIEPAECFNLNNLLREYQIAYRREKERILLEVTDQIRPELPEIDKNLDRLGLFDFIRAKALLGLDMKAVFPILSRHPGIQLVQAYHPLLRLSHEKSGQETVPLDLHLSKDEHILVISGPNAGGKSVCLKTTGILQYMLQCGLLVPCASHSEMGIYKQILADIGDEQSIENDLSTYSSHLLNMKEFCEFSDARTLFLIDEFGTGTDPQFGGPLAEAILDHLARKRAHGVVTTHFSNLKHFASNHKGLQNASMLFDQEKMKPLFKLEIGKPGSSYAFELAVKSGLPDSIISYARSRVGGKQKKVEDLLVELEKESKQVASLKDRLENRERKLDTMTQHYEKLTAELEQNKRLLMKRAKEEALSIVTEARKQIEAAIREVREQQANTESQRNARTLVNTNIEKIQEDLKEIPAAPPKPKESVSSNQKLSVGDTVRIAGQEAHGTIIEIIKTKAVVAIGELHSTIPLSKLERLTGSAKKKQEYQSVKGISLNQRMQTFSPELNLIGVRGEEATKLLENYLDEALLLGVKQVRIVHGKGYGILRKLVREQLQRMPQVEEISDEHIDFGGDGVTNVTLRM